MHTKTTSNAVQTYPVYPPNRDKQDTASSRAIVLFAVVIAVIGLCHSALSSAETITYYYDEDAACGSASDHTGAYRKGRLCGMNDSAGNLRLKYDQRGNIKTSARTIDASTYTTQTTYDALNRVSTLTYPDGVAVSYGYDNAGQLKTVGSYVTDMLYTPNGQIDQITYGNDVVTDYTYADTNTSCPRYKSYLVCKINTTAPGGNQLEDLTYSYDDVGNVDYINDPINGNQDFDYDDLNRLMMATAPGRYGNFNYQYNAIGNLTQKTRTGASNPANDYNSTYQYSYFHPHAVERIGNMEYFYDISGNLINGGGRLIAYDGADRPKSIVANDVITTFQYDGNSSRIKKTANGITTKYISASYECTHDGTTETCTKYIFSGTKRIAQVTAGNTRYFHSDHLSSNSVVSDANGDLDKRYSYYPYGETQPVVDWSDTVAVSYKYTDQELDDSTGLYNYDARLYDAALSRFTTADSMGVDPNNPQTLNRYSYALNNPLRYNDPTGHYADDAFGSGSDYNLQCVACGNRQDFAHSVDWSLGMDFSQPSVADRMISNTASWVSQRIENTRQYFAFYSYDQKVLGGYFFGPDPYKPLTQDDLANAIPGGGIAGRIGKYWARELPANIRFGSDDLILGFLPRIHILKYAYGGITSKGAPWMNRRFTSKEGWVRSLIDGQLARGGHIRFDISGMDNLKGILADIPTGKYISNTTSIELRYIKNNWSIAEGKVTFYDFNKTGNPAVPPPWTSP